MTRKTDVIVEKLREAYHGDLSDCPILIDAAEALTEVENRAEKAETLLRGFRKLSADIMTHLLNRSQEELYLADRVHRLDDAIRIVLKEVPNELRTRTPDPGSQRVDGETSRHDDRRSQQLR